MWLPQDYFAAQAALTPIFAWEHGNKMCTGMLKYMALICGDVAFPHDLSDMRQFLTVHNALLGANPRPLMAGILSADVKGRRSSSHICRKELHRVPLLCACSHSSRKHIFGARVLAD